MTGKPISSALVALVAVTMLVPPTALSAQDTPPTPMSVVDGVFTSEQAERGKKQFQQTCAACHSTAQ